MEIYLLRDEKEVGPYAAEDVHAWLQQGHVSATELAWSEGYAEWQPLAQLLGLELVETAPALAFVPEPEPEPEPVPVGPAASPRQKAFLTYMGVSFAPELREADAERLTQEVTQNRKNAKRLAKWEDDRLDLHPEMFVAEIQARMKNRPNYFFRMVETEGADCFHGVTKAHCQVLVGYLDVNHPHWDAKQSEATWKFFFPAIAEKFPQLVRKEWRSKLKFKESGKVAPDPSRSSRRSSSGRPSNLARNIAATAAVLVMLFLFGGVALALFMPERLPEQMRLQVENAKASAAAFIRGDQPPAKPAAKTTSPPGKEVTAVKPQPSTAKATPRASSSTPAAAKTVASAGAPAPATSMPAATEPGSPPAPAGNPENMAPTPLPRPMEALFNPHAFATPAPAAGAPIVDTGKSVTILQPVTIQTTYGKVTIGAGTSVKVIGVDGETVRVNYMNSVIAVPSSATDLGTAR